MNASTKRNCGHVAIGAIIAAIMLALAISFCTGIVGTDSAYATIYTVPESEQAADVDERVTTVDGTSIEEAEAAEEDAEGESIEDDETPMSSGLGGGEPVAGGIGFGGIAVAGIAIVAVFFLVLMRKLNGNINDMRTMFK